MAGINRKNVRAIVEAYESILDRASDISSLPESHGGFSLDDEFRIETDDSEDELTVVSYEILSGYDDSSLNTSYKNVPIALFKMSQEEFDTHKRQAHIEHEQQRRDAEHERAMREVAARERKERAEFERLKAKFEGET